jgi:glutamate synthase domain-containing protein 3
MVGLGRLDTQDEQNIRALLIRHLELTGSPLAADLLRRWEAVSTQFVRVRPRGDTQIQIPATLVRLRERVIAAQ